MLYGFSFKDGMYYSNIPIGVPNNDRLAPGNGRFRASGKYKAYKKAVSLLPSQCVPIAKIKGKKNVVMGITIYEPNNRRDIDATIKILQDVHIGRFYEDDSQIWKINQLVQLVDKENPRVECYAYEQIRS